MPADARRDLGYVLCRAQWHLQNDRLDDAAQVILAAAPETMAHQDTDAWWRERRLIARKLLDQGKFKTAYRRRGRRCAARQGSTTGSTITSCAAGSRCAISTMPRRRWRISRRIDEGSVNPIALSRATTGAAAPPRPSAPTVDMRRSYQAAARYPTAYYGQLAREKLGPRPRRAARALAGSRQRCAGRRTSACAPPTCSTGSASAICVFSFVEEFAKESNDVSALEAMAELTGNRNDARAMLEIGKTALARGLRARPLRLPDHRHSRAQAGCARDRASVIYSVARTESAFDQRDKSPANAVGLMQVTPEAGRDTARRFGVTYDWDRMVSDPVYNTQMGAAELSRAVLGISRQPDHDLRWLQCRPRPGEGMDQGARRSPRSEDRSRSTGSSASRSPRRATTCSA